MSSLFGKIFGKLKEEELTPEQAIQKLRDTEELLFKKQEFMEKKIEDEKANALKHSKTNKRMALHALGRKRNYEKQLAQIDGTLQTIEFQRQALENSTSNAEVLSVLAQAGKALKKAHNDMDVDKVHDLMDDIADQQAVANELADAISRPLNGVDPIDDDELLKELEDLEAEDAERQLLAGPAVPAIPLPEVPEVVKTKPGKVAKSATDKELEELDAWAAS